MKVKLLTAMVRADDRRSYVAGDVIEVSKGEGERLIASQQAVAVASGKSQEGSRKRQVARGKSQASRGKSQVASGKWQVASGKSQEEVK